MISGCNVIKDGFASPKKNSGDEFMVEKKSPLVMPPNFNDLPIPSSENNLTNNDKSAFKDLIIKSKINAIDSKKLKKNDKNLETSILKKIKTD